MALLDWCRLLQHRDDILKKLRFDGHGDRSSFFQSSLQEYILRSYGIDDLLIPTIPSSDVGWKFSDLNVAILSDISIAQKEWNSKTCSSLPLLVAASYFRIFDEIFYGQSDWKIVFNLLRFLKYSVDSHQADLLTLAVLGSFSADEIRGLKLYQKFYS